MIKTIIGLWLEFKHYRFLFCLLGSIICLFSVLVYYALPQISNYEALLKDQVILQKKIESLESFALKHKDYQSVLEKHQEEYIKLRELLPPDRRENYYIARLQNTAKEAGGNLVSTSVKQENNLVLVNKKDFSNNNKNRNASLECYDIGIKYLGKYEEILKFLHILDNNHKNGLNSIIISAGKGETLSLEGNFNVYFSK